MGSKGGQNGKAKIKKTMALFKPRSYLYTLYNTTSSNGYNYANTCSNFF